MSEKEAAAKNMVLALLDISEDRIQKIEFDMLHHDHVVRLRIDGKLSEGIGGTIAQATSRACDAFRDFHPDGAA